MKKQVTLALMIAAIFAVNQCANEDAAAVAGSSCSAPKTDAVANGGTLSGFLGNVTVAQDATVTLSGTVTVCSGSTLTINPGVTVKASTSQFSFLFVQAGAKIEASGTAAKPIVFTSDKTAGSRARQDWGGIVINGNAQVNQSGATGEGNTGSYGGTNDADNSGTLKYVRVEFAGKDFSSENELNGVCLQGVGSGTTIDYLHVHNNNDDGIEMFGGNVSLKHLISTANGDDQLDATFGWRGKVQYAFLMPLIAKTTNDAASGCNNIGSAGTGTCGNRAIEFDNNSSTNTATPLGVVYLANVTAINADNGEDLVRIREGALTVHFYNSHFIKNKDGGNCLDVRNSATVDVYSSVFEGASNNRCNAVTASSGVIEANNAAQTSPLQSTVAGHFIYRNDGNSRYTLADIDTLAELQTNGATQLAQNGAIQNVPTATTLSGVTVPTTVSSTGFDAGSYIGHWDGTTNWTTWTSFPAN